MATTHRVRLHRAAPTPPRVPIPRAHRRRGAPGPFVIAAGRHRPAGLLHRPARCCRAWIAVLGAAFSVLLIGLMAGAVALCADRACLADPGPAGAVLELDRAQPTPLVVVTPGRPPSADQPR